VALQHYVLGRFSDDTYFRAVGVSLPLENAELDASDPPIIQIYMFN